MKDSPLDIICPISREVFVTPLVCSDGFSYEKSFVTKWLNKKDNSPMLGSPLKDKSLKENKALCSYLDAYQHLTHRLSSCKLSNFPIPNFSSALNPKLKEELKVIISHYYKSTLELDDCCKRIEAINKKVPNNFDVLINYANIMRFSAGYDKTFEILNKIKELVPVCLIPDYMRVRTLSESKKKDEANKCLTEIQAKNRIEDHTLIELRFLSYSLFSTSNRDSAYKIVFTYLKVVPKDIRALSHCIYINLIQENYTYVIEESKKYLEVNPDDVSILFHQAKAYSVLEKKKEAINIYRQIVGITVDKVVKARALYESAINREESKELEQIIREMEESYNCDPNEEGDVYLAELYTKRNQFDTAKHWLEQCAKRLVIENSPQCLEIKAKIEVNNKNYDEAVEHYIRLTEIDSVNNLYYNAKIEDILQKRKLEN